MNIDVDFPSPNQSMCGINQKQFLIIFINTFVIKGNWEITQKRRAEKKDGRNSPCIWDKSPLYKTQGGCHTLIL